MRHNFKSDEVIDVLKAYDFLDKNPAVYKINKSVIQKSLKIHWKIRIRLRQLE